MIKIDFTGDILSTPYKTKCIKNLKIILRHEKVFFNTKDYSIEMMCKKFTIISFKIKTEKPKILDRLTKVMNDNFDIIVP